jgi:hypothetical protein
MIGPLVGALRRYEGDEALVEAAAESLDRITGAGLRIKIEEPWETGLPPELREPAERVGATKPMRIVEKVIVDPVPWETWMKSAVTALNAARKHRSGRPFSPLQVVDELESKTTPWQRRPDAAFELACILGTTSGFRTDDWVERQRLRLAELRGEIERLEPAQGAWWFHRAPSGDPGWRRR